MFYPVPPILVLPTSGPRSTCGGLAFCPSPQATTRTEETALWEVLMRPA